MYARVLRMQFKPDMMPAAAKVAEEFVGEMEKLEPTFHKLSGFQGKYALLDQEAGEIMVLTLFATQEDALAYVGTEPQQRLNQFVQKFSGISGVGPLITTCKVIGQVMAAPQLIPA